MIIEWQPRKVMVLANSDSAPLNTDIDRDSGNSGTISSIRCWLCVGLFVNIHCRGWFRSGAAEGLLLMMEVLLLGFLGSYATIWED